MRVEGSIVYQERTFFWILSVIFIPLILIFLLVFIYQLNYGSVGNNPAPEWFYLIMILLFLILELGFSSYNLIITTDMLVVGFPIYSKKIPWSKIVGVEESSEAAWKYGGFGIRITIIEGKKALAIIIPGKKRLKLKLNDPKLGFLIVSPKNLDTVMNYIRQEIEIWKGR